MLVLTDVSTSIGGSSELQVIQLFMEVFSSCTGHNIGKEYTINTTAQGVAQSRRKYTRLDA